VNEEEKTESISISKKSVKRLAGAILLALLLLIAGYLVFHKGNKPAVVDISQLQAAKQYVNFQIYYPKPQPGYMLQPNTVQANNGVVSFIYGYGSDNINISEQAQPPVVEQVTKTRQFSTPAGSAYLADLNGHTAGFIQADKTLVILSSSGNIPDKLQSLMTNFQRLD